MAVGASPSPQSGLVAISQHPIRAEAETHLSWSCAVRTVSPDKTDGLSKLWTCLWSPSFRSPRQRYGPIQCSTSRQGRLRPSRNDVQELRLFQGLLSGGRNPLKSRNTNAQPRRPRTGPRPTSSAVENCLDSAVNQAGPHHRGVLHSCIENS